MTTPAESRQRSSYTSSRPGSGDFPDAAFKFLADAGSRHFWFRGRNKLITWAIEKYFPRAERLLEVGCGPGVVLAAIHERFPRLELVGGDLSGEALRLAGRRVPTASLVGLDVSDIPFREAFDVVCAFDVLEHVDHDGDALLELASATKSGGGVLVTVPQYEWLWSAADVYGGHRRRYTKLEIETRVRDAGLTILLSTGWVAALLPIVALSRLRDRVSREPYDPTREFRLPASIDRAFGLTLDLERAAIRRGIPLPVGTSRLVVACKS